MGWWSWCCDSRDCGGLRGIRGIGVIVIVMGIGRSWGDTCFVVI